MASGLTSLLMGFLPRGLSFLLLCAAYVGFFGIFVPLMERKKKREEQAFYRSRAQKEREENERGEQSEEQEN